MSEKPNRGKQVIGTLTTHGPSDMLQAVQRPQPVAEIVVEKLDERTLVMEGVNSDARLWLYDQAAAYGELLDWDTVEIVLRVSRLYDIDQVKAWLEGGYQG